MYYKILNTQIINENGDSLLIKAINKNDINLVDRLLKYEVAINHTNSRGYTALMYACINKDSQTVKKLLEQGASLEIYNQEKVNALMYALKFNDKKSVTYLIEQGAALINQESPESSPILTAMQTKDLMDFILNSSEEVRTKVESQISLITSLSKKQVEEILSHKQTALEPKKTMMDGKNKVFTKENVKLMNCEIELEYGFYLIVDETEDYLSTYRISTYRTPKCLPIRVNNRGGFVLTNEVILFNNIEYEDRSHVKGSQYEMIIKAYQKGNHEINDLNIEY
jgi:hypothetical protein